MKLRSPGRLAFVTLVAAGALVLGAGVTSASAAGNQINLLANGDYMYPHTPYLSGSTLAITVGSQDETTFDIEVSSASGTGFSKTIATDAPTTLDTVSGEWTTGEIDIPLVDDSTETDLPVGDYYLYIEKKSGDFTGTNSTHQFAVTSGHATNAVLATDDSTIVAGDATHDVTLTATDEGGSVLDITAGSLTLAQGDTLTDVPFTKSGTGALTISVDTSKLDVGTATLEATHVGATADSSATDISSNVLDLDVVEPPHVSTATIRRSTPNVYPHKDGYGDTVSFTTGAIIVGDTDATWSGTVKITKGTKTVATLPVTEAKPTAKWKGLNSGKIVPGKYTATTSLSLDGKYLATAKATVTVSARVAVRKSVTTGWTSAKSVFTELDKNPLTNTKFSTIGGKLSFRGDPKVSSKTLVAYAFSAQASPSGVKKSQLYGGSVRTSATIVTTAVSGKVQYLFEGNKATKNHTLKKGTKTTAAVTAYSSGSPSVLVLLGFGKSSFTITKLHFAYSYLVLK